LVTAALAFDHPRLNWILVDFEVLPRVGEDIIISTDDEAIHLKVMSITHPIRLDNDGAGTYYPNLYAKVIK